jgi:hypothetical protein
LNQFCFFIVYRSPIGTTLFQAPLEKSIPELFLPEGILEYFDVRSVEKTDEGCTISLEEKNLGSSGKSGGRLY